MKSVIAVGSHPDDIELGCGGTLAKHVAAGDNVIMLVVTNGQAGPGPVDRRKREAEDAAAVLGATIIFGDLPDGTVSNHELTLVHLIENTIKESGATVVYTHGAQDSHQDHRAVAMATNGAARQVPMLLAYDSPSSSGFAPTVYVDISDTLDKKVTALECHASQVANSSMASPQMVRALAQVRGFHARVAAAEGFLPVRVVLSI